jgi:hypothetical protein
VSRRTVEEYFKSGESPMTAEAAATRALGKATDKGGRKETMNQRVKLMARTSSLSEKPRSQGPRRLAEWLNPTGAKKVHSLGDKIVHLIPSLAAHQGAPL